MTDVHQMYILNYFYFLFNYWKNLVRQTFSKTDGNLERSRSYIKIHQNETFYLCYKNKIYIIKNNVSKNRYSLKI